MAAKTTRTEQSILGKIIQDKNESLAQTVPISLFCERHKIVLLTIRELISKDNPIEVNAIIDFLENKDALRDVGGEGYIATLSESGKGVTDVHQSLKILEDASVTTKTHNQILDVATRIEAGLINGEEALQEMNEFMSRIGSNFDGSGGLVQAGEYIKDVLESVESGDTGYQTGFDHLDSVLVGLEPQNLVIIAARPSLGKSSIARAISYNMAMEDIGVAYNSYEESGTQMTRGFLSMISKVPVNKLKKGNLSKQDWVRLTDASKLYKSLPIYLDETPPMKVGRMEYDLQRRADDIDVVIVDYIQEIASNPSSNRHQELGRTIKHFKAMAKRYNKVFIVLSQLSRGVEWDERRPKLIDLRECGNIEESADIVLFLHEFIPGYDDRKQSGDMRTVSVAKSKDGKRNVELELGWHGATKRFFNI